MKQYTVKWCDQEHHTFVDEFHADHCQESKDGLWEDFYIRGDLVRRYKKDCVLENSAHEESQ